MQRDLDNLTDLRVDCSWEGKAVAKSGGSRCMEPVVGPNMVHMGVVHLAVAR